MAKKYLTPPTEIQLRNLVSGGPAGTMTFREFVFDVVGGHPMWTGSLNDLRALDDLRQAVEAADDGIVELPSSVYDKLRACVEKPAFMARTPQGIGQISGFGSVSGTVFTGPAAIQLLPFVDAILDAKEEPPRLAAVAAK
jgi:hypothetical protein